MKKFIFKILLFTIPVIFIAYGLDRGLSEILKRSKKFADGEYPTWNDLYAGKINSNIVIYGSSRAVFHINPKIIEDSLHVTSYNLGINGHTFLLQYLRHKVLFEYNLKPSLIIMAVDVTTLVKGKNLYNPDQFLPYMLNNKEMKDISLRFNGYKSIDYKIPLLRYYGKKEALLEILKIIFHPSGNKPWRTKGYRGNESSWNDDLKKAQEQIGTFEVRLDSSLVKQFDSFLCNCKSNGQNLVLVYTPEYIDGQKFEKDREKVISMYEKFSKKYNIPYIDYSNDSLSYEKNYFYNSGHLNKKGSELFTNKLVRELKCRHIYD